MKTIRFEDCFLTNYPELAKEWNYEKNGSLTPQTVSAGSGKKVWWRCDKGHEWQAKITNRSLLGYGCPYCSNQKVLVGYNDLATTNPQLATEWNADKNGALTPQMVVAGSGKKVWWKCDKGHEWQAQICGRKKHGCPVCAIHRKKKN